MGYDNRPQLVELNRAGFACRAEQLDLAKSCLGMSYVLAAGATPVTVTGTAAETTLLSVPVPGGLLGLNGALRVYTLWTMTPSVNSKVLRNRFGAADLMAGRTITAATTMTLAAQRVIQNRNSEASQVSFSGWVDMGTNTTPPQVSAVNTAVDQLLTITAQLGLSTESVTLESWFVEVAPF